jgi:fumarate reductase flavoprotein subunit
MLFVTSLAQEEEIISMIEKKSGTQFDRRTFLKGVAATGAMGAIAAAYSTDAAQPAEDNKNARSWRDKPDPIGEALISDGGTYDVVVVGGGNAGMICASAAAAKGASVAVIENQAEKGYVPGAGKEVANVNSQYNLNHGAPRIKEDDFLRELARRNVIRHNPKRASYFVKNSGKVFDWVISFTEKGWMEENCHVMSCPPLPAVITEVSGWKFYHGTAIFLNKNETTGKETWPELLYIHREKAEARGAKWFFDHHAEICDLDASGAVTGVVAKRKDGSFIRFKARKGVALCAGDFSGNREMVLDILDTLRHEAEAKGDLTLVKAGMGIGGLTRDGSGIKLGIWAGGHVEIGPHSTMGAGDPGTGVWFMQLDENGERFYDEAAGTTLSRSKDSFTVTILDSNWKKVLEMMPPRHGSVDTADATSWPPTLKQLDNVKPGPQKNSWGKDRFLRWSLQGDLYCANSIEELFDYMDCYKEETKKKALAEIKRYNGMCKKGVDEDFGKDPRIMKATGLKDPPFYGTVNKSGGTNIMSMMGGGISPGMVSTTGLDTDAEGRVLNSEFKPIKRLYAAGNNAGGRFITVYQSPMSGISIGMAVTEGYMLGERLAGL